MVTVPGTIELICDMNHKPLFTKFAQLPTDAGSPFENDVPM
jgi:hypothetical protein